MYLYWYSLVRWAQVISEGFNVFGVELWGGDGVQSSWRTLAEENLLWDSVNFQKGNIVFWFSVLDGLIIGKFHLNEIYWISEYYI